MHVTQLSLSDFRRFPSLSWRPASGLNLVRGDNGAGKTTLIEALHLLAYGRSFRGRVAEGLIRRGQPHLEVFAEWRAAGRLHRVGLRHSGRRWEARLDGEPVSTLGQLCAALAVVTFEPGSQQLLTGSAEARRRFLDWTLFHVEPTFLALWRRFERALKQRNALLKADGAERDFGPWEAELAQAGETITVFREQTLVALGEPLRSVCGELLPELGVPALDYLPGWPAAEHSLAAALARGRGRDRSLGHTESGAHRADWRLRFAGGDPRRTLSRGQGKLATLACLLAQAFLLRIRSGEMPILCLDDLASEIDATHRHRLIELLKAAGGQLIVTGAEIPQEFIDPCRSGDGLFHVEQGSVREARVSQGASPESRSGPSAEPA